MERNRLLLITLAAVVLPIVLCAQDYHRNLPIGHMSATSCKASSDGGMFLSFEEYPNYRLVKLDDAGEFVWARWIPNCVGHVADENGGVLVFRPWDGIEQSPEEEPYDSFLLQQLNSNGDMVLNRRIQIYDTFSETSESVESSVWTSGGELFLAMKLNFNDGRIMKFSSDLELLWTISSTVDDYEQIHLSELPDGGVMMYQFDNSPTNLAAVTRLDPNGNEVWHRTLNVSGTALGGDGSSILVDNEGSVMMAFTATSGPFPNYIPWLVVAKMDINANMTWRHAYRRQVGEEFSSFYQGYSYNSPGRILPNGNVFFGTDKGFEVTPQGLFVRELICSTPTNASGFDDISHAFTTWPSNDGWIQIGMRRWTAPLFGNFVEMPLIGRTPLNLDSTCFWTCTERTDVTIEPPPPEIIVPVASTLYVQPHTSISEDWPVENLTEATLDILEDACQLPEIVEFNTSVPEQQGPVLLGLYPNPVITGQALQVDAEGPLVLEVVDARGRMVARQLNGTSPALLNTVGLDAGLYLVRASHTNGQLLGTGRLVVQ